ncbi:glycosyltransferase [Planococcus sp. ANT_H30]|uniref:glycosyltransferase n=1 Tax=Planococcus sp. ANT_H30 TaxID=2597347 RepID=UPI0011F04477|nr:glycosyltransferase [Planococcus sp. ANT_H30]KAA0958753.1 glycosyltransferase [Planococcus sp. ANT_H30]
MKKRILFIYPDMMIGGSTTSLLSILNLFDYSKYEVDLILGINDGPLYNMIPSEVNILKQAHPYPNRVGRLFNVLLKPSIGLVYIKAQKLAMKRENLLISHQIMAYEKIKMDRIVETYYDVAIGFLECWPTAYLASNVNAERKIAWLHLDYLGSGLEPKYDQKSYDQFDNIVVVSENCKESFNQSFPDYSFKSLVIENILSEKTILEFAEENDIDLKIDKNYINMVTTCRIVFSHKGLDRAIKILGRLKREQTEFNIRWYIIGNGPDYEKLRSYISTEKLEENIFLLGEQKNPFKYMKDMDLFFLPSRYEGKPMAITEAHMLGLPSLVTEYVSSREQIEDGIDGVIVNNDDISLYESLMNLNKRLYDIDELKKNIKLREYSNIEEFDKIEKLIEG